MVDDLDCYMRPAIDFGNRRGAVAAQRGPGVLVALQRGFEQIVRGAGARQAYSPGFAFYALYDSVF